MADIFDVVSDPTRREVMAALLQQAVARDAAAGEISVGDLVERLGLSQPTVSKHLRVLRDHGLVTVREDGQHRYYRLDPAPLDELEDWLRPYLEPALEEDDVPVDDGRSAVFAAWSGADVGETIGRTAADGAHRVVRTLPKVVRRRLFRRF